VDVLARGGDREKRAVLVMRRNILICSGTDGLHDLVWEFSCQVIVWFVAGSLFGAERPFLVPSPAIRFPERAEGVKGPKW
jgi:hypothetical protein